MAQVDGLSKARMLEIEAASIVDGDVVGDNLVLTKRDGTSFVAGAVRGAIGPSAPTASAETPNTLALRDANGRFSAANPVELKEVTNKDYVDALASGKASHAYVNDTKTAILAYVDGKVAPLATTASVDTKIAPLATTASVDTKIAPLTTKTYVDNLVSTSVPSVIAHVPAVMTNFSTSGNIVVETQANGKRRAILNLRINRTVSNYGVLSSTAWTLLGTIIPTAARFTGTAGITFATAWANFSEGGLPVSLSLDTSTGSLSIKAIPGHVSTMNIGHFVSIYMVVNEA